MAQFEILGCIVNRDPVPVKHPVTKVETTGWEFSARTVEGDPIPGVVIAISRSKGLTKTRKAISKYLAAQVAVVPDIVPEQSN